jgi:hypothetical protein
MLPSLSVAEGRLNYHLTLPDLQGGVTSATQNPRVGNEMPFSSLSDPSELSLAAAALEAAWKEIRTANRDEDERGRITLAYIVGGLVPAVKDGPELFRLSLERYRDMNRPPAPMQSAGGQEHGQGRRSA